MSFFTWFRRRRDDALDAEIRGHITMAVHDRVARGETTSGATAAVRREFGNVTHVKEITRDGWAGAAWERLEQDVRYAVRALSRAPAFAAVAVVTLALGIGANTAIFSVLDAVILRPLPYPHAERLLYITSQFPTMNLDHFPLDIGEYVDLRERNRSFESLAGISTGAVNIGAQGSPQRVAAALTAGDLFHTLGVAPQLGRAFTDADALPAAAPVAILSHEVWQTTYGGRPAILGSQVDIDGVPTTVVGVMPAGFDFRDQGIRIWQPLTINPAQIANTRGNHFLNLVGRLKVGVTQGRAESELQTLLMGWAVADGGTFGVPIFQEKIHTPTPTDHRLRYDNLQADIVGPVRPALWLLQGAVALVLLIACANMANLLLVRAESRHRELAVRAALGAGRWRLMRQFVAESVVLSVIGGALGVVLAQWGLHALIATSGGSIPRVSSVHLDGTVLAFTVVLAIGTGVVFGLAPLLQLGGTAINATLRGSEGRTTASASRHRVRGALVAVEMAFAVILVVGAGLLLRSAWNLMRVDSGFDRSQLTTFSVTLPQPQYTDLTKRANFFDDLVQRLRALPGVQSVAAMSGLPPVRPINANDTQFEGYVPKPGGPQQNVDYWQWATPDYLATMKIPVVAGRGFEPADGAQSPPVVLINETLAKRFYPGENPLGRRVQPGGSKDFFTIVGIVKDVKQAGLDSKTGTELYIDVDQWPQHIPFGPATMNIVIRSPSATRDLSAGIHRTLASVDPMLPVAQLQSMDEVFAAATSRPHFLMELLGIFAAIALSLAAIGTYGVLSYSVAERRRELGIRMALGAGRPGVLAMVLGRGIKSAGIGLVAGLVGALVVTRLATALLFGVTAADPLTFGAVAVFMLGVAFVACVIPAWRATRVDPMVALRTE